MPDQITMKKRYKLLISSAKSRGIKVDLNTQYYSDLISMGCLYCGDSLSDKTGTCLDRQDSKQGYTNQNVVGCCHICNYAKRTLSDDAFYAWVERAFFHQLNCKKIAQDSAVEHNYRNKKENTKKLNIYFNTVRVKCAEVLKYNP